MNICFETFGCRLNRAEALENEAACRARGHTIVERPADADLIVIRGCSITARAQREGEQFVSRLREKYPTKRLFVTGCLPAAKKFALSLALPAAAAGAETAPPVPTRTARAYLKVQDGCSCQCTFCIVPRFRGAPTSVPFAHVLDRAKRFIEAGYREIVVTGCNLCLYADGPYRLPDLTAALAALSPDCRIRLGSIEPGPVARDLLSVMIENEAVCRFLHLSVQSGSDRILAAMRRPYAVKEVDALVSRAVRDLPFIGLGCDLIAGFPGESEMDFRLTQGLLRRHPFSNIHAFAYSERPGTIAAGLPSKITPDIRHARARELSALGAENRRRFLKRFIGRTVEVVIERRSLLAGWTGEYAWFEEATGPAGSIAGKRPSRRKELIPFKVTEARNGHLYGTEVRRGR